MSDVVDANRPITYGIVQPGPRLRDGEGVPIIRGQDYSSGTVATTELYWVRPEIAAAYERSVVRAGDLLISIVGYVGAVAQVPFALDGANLTQTTARLAIHEKHSARYFLHYLRSSAFQDEVKRFTKGSAQPGLNLSDVEVMRVRFPSAIEQLRIAEILDTLDEAIHKTERLIAKLKLVNQGLLHDLLTRGLGDRGELRNPVLHPEQFKESELGLIPKDWEVAPLERWLACPPKNGYSPEAAPEPTGCVMLGLGCLTPNGFRPLQLKNAPRSDEELQRATLRTGDLLMSRANTRELVGFAGRYLDVGVPCTFPDLMMRLVPDETRTTSEYLELVLRSSAARRQIQAAAVGTSASMVKISGRIVRRLVVGIAPPSEQHRILRIAQAASARIANEEASADKLRQLQSGLMDDLLTGRVRVTKLLNQPAA